MKPIIFSTPMVQAILDGKKTQTRRVIKIDDAPENWNISIAGTSIVRRPNRMMLSCHVMQQATFCGCGKRGVSGLGLLIKGYIFTRRMSNRKTKFINTLSIKTNGVHQSLCRAKLPGYF